MNRVGGKLLECSHLKIGYKTPLCRDLHFDLYPGQITLIKGANGSGKTTLIKTLMNKMKFLGGHFKWLIKEKEISYLPQITNPESHFSYTVSEILELYDLPSKRLKQIDPKLKSKKWINCSGGERQKVMLFTRIHRDTKVLILDEPFNHLDSNSVSDLASMLTSLVEGEKALSLLLVSHLEVSFPDKIFKKVELVP